MKNDEKEKLRFLMNVELLNHPVVLRKVAEENVKEIIPEWFVGLAMFTVH